MTFKLDHNHHEIVEAFKKLGCKVVDNAQVKRHEPNQLDIWVGFPMPSGSLGIWVYVEIKTEYGKLRPGQRNEIQECQDKGLPVEVVKDMADVEEVYNKYLDIMSDLTANFCRMCKKVIPFGVDTCDHCIPF